MISLELHLSVNSNVALISHMTVYRAVLKKRVVRGTNP